MNAKLKYTLSVAILVVAIVATAGITYGVMAAQQVTLNSPINVGYTAQEVAATLSATYQIGSDSAVDFKTASNETEIVFDGTETTTGNGNVKAFVAPSNLTLTSSNKTITFVFTIKNDMAGSALTATLTLPTTQTNVTVTKTGDSNTINVAAGQTATYTVTVTVTNVANDASFAGDFSWNLTRAA